jgi:hypothetical protein
VAGLVEGVRGDAVLEETDDDTDVLGHVMEARRYGGRLTVTRYRRRPRGGPVVAP